MKSRSIFTLNTKRGFTLLEVILSLGILTIIAGLGFVVSLDFYRTYFFNADRDTFVGVLQSARAKAMSNINESNFGVYVESSSYTLFQGVSYVLRDVSQDSIISTSPRITKTGLSEVVFSQLSGDANITGDIWLHAGTSTATISIQTNGRIGW